MVPIKLAFLTCKIDHKWVEKCFQQAPFQVLQRRNKFVVNICIILNPVSLAFTSFVPMK